MIMFISVFRSIICKKFSKCHDCCWSFNGEHLNDFILNIFCCFVQNFTMYKEIFDILCNFFAPIFSYLSTIYNLLSNFYIVSNSQFLRIRVSPDLDGHLGSSSTRVLYDPIEISNESITISRTVDPIWQILCDKIQKQLIVYCVTSACTSENFATRAIGGSKRS